MSYRNFSLFRKPTQLEQITAELDRAHVDLLAAAANRETWTAWETMLKGRINRLEALAEAARKDAA